MLKPGPQKPQGVLGTGRKGAGGGMEVGEEGDHIAFTTLSPPERLLHEDGQR